jgi:hypothetical protein
MGGDQQTSDPVGSTALPLKLESTMFNNVQQCLKGRCNPFLCS